MPFIRVPITMKVTMHWTLDGRTGSNSWYIEYLGSWSPTDVLNLLNDLHNIWVAQIQSSLTTLFEATDWTAEDLDNSLNPTVVKTVTDTGTNSNVALPPNVTCDVYWPGLSRYRGGKVHSFLTGFVETALATGNPRAFSTGFLSAVAGWANAFQAQINTTTYGTLGSTKLIIVHYFSNHVRLTPPTKEIAQAPRVEPAVHSRSRRLAR